MSARDWLVFGGVALCLWPFVAAWSLWVNAGNTCGLLAIVFFLFAIYVRIGEKR